MIWAIINVLLYFGFLLFYWGKKHTVDNGFLLIALWGFVALNGFFMYIDNPNLWHLRLWPFIYIFIIFLVFMRYFFKEKDVSSTLSSFAFQKSKTIDVMCYFYIFCAIYNIYTSGFDLTQLSLETVESSSQEAYDYQHSEGAWNFHGGSLDYIILNYEYYFAIAALICGFNCLCQGRKLVAITLIILPFLSDFLEGIRMGSRSTIASDILMYLGAFILYKKLFSKTTKRVFVIISSVAGLIILAFIIAMTTGRFGTDEVSAGIWDYFGQSMLRFNYGISDSLNGTFYGSQTFGYFYKYLGISVPTSLYADTLGCHVSSGFITLFGFLCLDFGYIGTLIVALILPWIINKMAFTNDRFTLPGLYIYLFFLRRMLRGSMVFYGMNAGLMYLSTFLFYFVLVLITKYSKLKKM